MIFNSAGVKIRNTKVYNTTYETALSIARKMAEQIGSDVTYEVQ